MSENKDTHKGHRQRMRDRALSEGFDAFNPHQVMEVLLFYAIPMKDVSELAHALIDRFGSVLAVINATCEELTEVSGVGAQVAEWLQRLGEVVEAYGELTAHERPRIENYRSAFEFCTAHRKAAPAVWQLCLTPSGTVQLYTEACDSLAWGEPVVLRQNLQHALAIHARNVIIAAFVPEAEPRVEDIDRSYAERYAGVLQMMGAELLDVILVGTEQVVSMHKNGDYDRGRFGDAKSVLAERYLREDAEEMDYGEELPTSDDGL